MTKKIKTDTNNKKQVNANNTTTKTTKANLSLLVKKKESDNKPKTGLTNLCAYSSDEDN